MTHTSDDLVDVHPRRQILALVLAVTATVPGMIIRFTEPELSAPIQALTFGLAIVGAAFVLAWAAEVAQLDISAGLAIAVLALIAVLPEYAVDLVFAWRGGEAYETYGAACGPAGGRLQRHAVLVCPGQHDRGQPAAHRSGVVDGGAARLVALPDVVATQGKSPERVTPAQLREMEGQTGSGITLDRGHTIEVASSQQPPSTR